MSASAGGFRLNPKQVEANRLLGGPATHILLRGGSRSGKTFILLRAMVVRALKAPETTHGVFRHRFNHLKHSVIFDTFPKVMKLCFTGVPFRMNQTDWFAEMHNGSRVIFGGLDEKERTEKILGQEYSSVLLNECSQISYDARNKVVTRLAQRSPLALKCYLDANPPTQGHWTYRLFEQGLEPRSGAPVADRAAYATMQMNPDANRANLAPEYIAQLESLPERDRRRFLLGEYVSQVEGALWSLDRLDVLRTAPPQSEAGRVALLERMRRVVVGVDPSGCSGPEDERSDEIGIVVAGLDHQGEGHVLEDLSGRYSPEGWAKAALAALDNWRADRIVAERNFGGALVESNIRAVRRTAPVTLVTASRGKTQRAEPIATLYEKGLVKHCGAFPDLEDQLCNFSTAGYQGARSPDRADAAIWSLSELMLGDQPVDHLARARALLR